MKSEAQLRDLLVSLQNHWQIVFKEPLTSEMMKEFLRDKLVEKKGDVLKGVLSLSPEDIFTALTLLEKPLEEPCEPKEEPRPEPKRGAKAKSKAKTAAKRTSKRKAKVRPEQG